MCKSATKSAGLTLQSLARDYYARDIKDPDILDLFAQKLWVERHTNDPYTADRVAWLAKILAKSGNTRYRSLLQKIVDDPSVPAKIKKLAKSSLKLLTGADTEQFFP